MIKSQLLFGNRGREIEMVSKKEENLKIWIGMGVIFLASVILIVVFLISALKKGVNAFQDTYKQVESQVKEEKKEEFYQKGYQAAEKENHVSNRAGISVENIKETANLEVLEVRDVEFVFQGADENDKNITVWLEVPGTGVFTVDLQASEFIVDNKRNYVLVRVPKIELSECKVDYANVNKLRFKNDIFNDSIAVGEDIAQEMLKDGYLLIQKEFLSNQWYYNSAESAAENLITNMIKEVNFDISDLQVEVEFME